MGERSLLIVGGGPVGLFAALCAHAAGLEVRVLERRRDPHAGSRSIGIHPPSIDRLAALGLASRFLERAVRVRRGLAFGSEGPLGRIDFACLPGRHRFVLTIPQHETEAILREALEERAPGVVVRGCEAVSCAEHDVAGPVEVRDVRSRRFEGDFVLVCDGRHSRIRDAMGVDFRGGPYRGSYAMLDAPDDTGFGDEAAIFLGRGGLVESFPLPDRARRWVVRRAGSPSWSASIDEIADTIEARTGHRISRGEARDASTFAAERYVATELSRGRIALAGDAAHVVSPIGGQGMNLGWLGAARLVSAIASRPELPLAVIAGRWARTERRHYEAAALRAELNMWLGRPTRWARSRDRLVRALLREPWSRPLARAFTMRGLFWREESPADRALAETSP